MERGASNRFDRPILLYLPSVEGGICEYVDAQANELVRRGYRVVMLAPRQFLATHPERLYEGRGVILNASTTIRWRAMRRAIFAFCAIVNPYVLACHVAWLKPQFVLLDAMSEWFAPLWAWPSILLARLGGVRYAATLHDPVRNRSFGPAWWHRLSLRMAYAPLSIGLVHDLEAAAKAELPGHIRLIEVPHGIFPAERGDATTNVRATLRIPEGAPVALSFGFVADRKNLGLAIEAMTRVPQLHLIIAGRVASSRDRPIDAYQAQAQAHGVADRCHFVDRYIDKGELGGFFGAADFLLMAYERSFISQSGVLHIAANWNLPVLASGGDGPLLNAVREYGLGEVIEPDSPDALIQGFQTMIARLRENDTVAMCAAWSAFREGASWRRNIDLLLSALDMDLRVDGT